MTSLLRACVLSISGFVVCGAPLAAQAQDGLPFAAHRAIYDLSLTKTLGSKAPTAARGRIVFDFSGSSCDGYVQNFRQMTELQPAEGETRISDMRSATYEDGAGKNFSFKVKTTINNGRPDDVDGRAQRSPGAVSIEISKPKRSKLDLDGEVVFPTEHMRRIVAAARAGEHVLEVKVYDGSDTGEKLFDTTSIIGKPTTKPADEKAAKQPGLENITRWPVAVSYFDPNKKDGVPNYVLSFDLYENGISRALKLDYGDFVLSGEMTSLELLPEKACKK